MMPSFNVISRRYTAHHKLLAQEKTSKVANWIYSAYSQVSLLTLCYHWKNLSILFLLELVIAENH